jgi:glycosyltransferase involved in cell wall biosynthesis
LFAGSSAPDEGRSKPGNPARVPDLNVYSEDCSAVILSVLAPVRDEGPAFREHVHACLRVVSDIDVEIVVLDNQSVDGCCHGLPREVLIVRTERVESPARLRRLGGLLASGQGLLWLPEVLSHAPDRFRAVVLAALELLRAEGSSDPDYVPRRVRFGAARTGPALLIPLARQQLNRWERIPVLGRVISAVAARQFRLVIPIGAVAPAQCRAMHESNVEKKPEPDASLPFRVRREAIRLSVIITAHNEGAEVLRTVESVRSNTRIDHEIIVMDDASDDGSCSGLEALGVRVIRHAERVGVAHSRDEGSRAAEGDAFAYLDAHQRVDAGCLDRCAELAVLHGAITCPPCRPLNRRYPVGYGDSFQLCPERGFFSARPRITRPRREITRVSGLRSPGYVIPRCVYRRVAWIAGLRGWGATDYCVAVKAFFADVDILHISGNATEHLFRKRIPYETTWAGVWRNQAVIARVCFDDRTWTRYWLPEVFRANLSEDVLQELDSAAVLAEREAFMTEKVRPDREFWRGLLRVPEPKGLTR